MNWTEEHDSVFCREIIFVNPFSAKKKSVQRSAFWQKVADTLNGITDPVFYVDKRSVRDHIGVLVQRFKRKEAKELKESGTNPTKTEVDVAIEQIIAMEESADEQHDLEDGEKKDKMEGDRLKAEEMRRTAMETMGKTQKRKSEEGQSKAKKCRRSGSETVEFLKLKAEQDMKQELGIVEESVLAAGKVPEDVSEVDKLDPHRYTSVGRLLRQHVSRYCCKGLTLPTLLRHASFLLFRQD